MNVIKMPTVYLLLLAFRTQPKSKSYSADHKLVIWDIIADVQTLVCYCTYYSNRYFNQILPGARPEIPEELRRRHRGCRAGAKLNAKQRRYKPSMPVILTGNVRSLVKKMDKLAAFVKTQKEFRMCSVMCFTKTWFHFRVSRISMLQYFSSAKYGRTEMWRGALRRKEGGLRCSSTRSGATWDVLPWRNFSSRYCAAMCGVVPILPRELTSAIVVAVYIPPSADAEAVCETVHSTVSKIQTLHPNAFITSLETLSMSHWIKHYKLSSSL